MKRALVIAAYAAFLTSFGAYWIMLGVAPDFHARVLQGEDRLVEWITFAGFAGACVLATSLLAKRPMGRRSRAYFLVLALFFFACAGEELSWGQRLLGFKTPEPIAHLSVQSESNIHNLEIRHFHPKDVVSWFMKLFGILLPLGLIRRMRAPGSTWRRYLSPPALIPCFLFAELVNLFQPQLLDFLQRAIGNRVFLVVKYQTEELIEMYWGVGVLLAMVFIRAAWKGNVPRVESEAEGMNQA